MQFASISRHSMPPAVAKTMMTGMVADRAAAAASLPREVSLIDPQAAWVTRPGIDPFFAYDANYLIDNKVGIIIDAEGTRANRVVEITVTQTMVDRVRRRFKRIEPAQEWRRAS